MLFDGTVVFGRSICRLCHAAVLVGHDIIMRGAVPAVTLPCSPVPALLGWSKHNIEEVQVADLASTADE